MEQVRIKRKLWNVYGYDVENHNDDESIAKNETSVWLSVFATYGDTEKDSVYFYDVESFLSHLEKITKRQTATIGGRRKRVNNNYLVYVYNLAHEWSFLLPVMLEKFSFEWKESWDENKEVNHVFNSISNKSCASVWEANLFFGKGHGSIRFVDLSKIFPSGLRKVAQSFGLKTQKGDLDYRLNRLHGHIVTDEERSYCFKDVEIMLEILHEMTKRDDEDFWKNCSSASYSMSKMIRQGYPHAYKPMQAYRHDYPILDADETDFLRRGVEGGITYAPVSYQFARIKHTIGHIDIHQAHPNSAYRYAYPYGKGHYFKGDRPVGRWICAQRIRISYSGVRLHSIIKLIGLDIVSDYELVVWDFEIAVMKMCYIDLKIEYIDGYAYAMKRLPWKEYYMNNYKAREKAKKKGDTFNIMFYKLLNNSSYGKLLEKPHNTMFENIIQCGYVDSVIHEKEAKDIKVQAKYTYLPVGSAIPARTRCYLIATAMKIGWQKVVYFDTDSIFYIKDEETEKNLKKAKVLGDDLGQFSHEKDIAEAQFTAPKRYKIKEIGDDGSLENVYHLAGINFGNDVPSYDDLDLLEGKYEIKGRKRAKGGTLIVLKEKQLQVLPKYRTAFERNKNKRII